MTELLICGLDRLESQLEKNPDLVISITDPGNGYDAEAAKRALDGYTGHVIPLQFHDVERLDYHSVAPSMDMARDTLELIKSLDFTPERVLVHCGMGQRRSPAIAMLAIGALMDDDIDPDEQAEKIVAQVMEAAPEAEPNRRIVEMTAMLLDLDYALVRRAFPPAEPVTKTKSKPRAVKASDLTAPSGVLDRPRNKKRKRLFRA